MKAIIADTDALMTTSTPLDSFPAVLDTWLTLTHARLTLVLVQLGLGDLADQLIPVDIEMGTSDLSFANDPIADVAAQGNLSMLLTNTGKVIIDTCAQTQIHMHSLARS
jgi:hypothetical protein